jgi:hypothetical protein
MYPYKPTSQPPLFYVLKDGIPAPEKDMAVVGACIADHQARNVGFTLLKAADGTEICISTDFMCVAPFMSPDPALLWETRVFWPGNEKWNGWEEHYASQETARKGHQTAMALVKAALLEEKK